MAKFKQNILSQLWRRILSISIALLIIFSSNFSNTAFAAKSTMSGDYPQDTISVIKTLSETIQLPKESESREEAKNEALRLITDYISRYRNRNNINTTQSFTTMQTALNAMAGHYKTFAKRPLPENLKERLEKEFALAQKQVLRDS